MGGPARGRGSVHKSTSSFALGGRKSPSASQAKQNTTPPTANPPAKTDAFAQKCTKCVPLVNHAVKRHARINIIPGRDSSSTAFNIVFQIGYALRAFLRKGRLNADRESAAGWRRKRNGGLKNNRPRPVEYPLRLLGTALDCRFAKRVARRGFAKAAFANGALFDHDLRRSGQNRRHSQSRAWRPCLPDKAPRIRAGGSCVSAPSRWKSLPFASASRTSSHLPVAEIPSLVFLLPYGPSIQAYTLEHIFYSNTQMQSANSSEQRVIDLRRHP